ncbi:MAG: HU family DNA-binding protein [Bacteroidaceae bacterium]|nr:HU family DNA-binding protein [Bacteroidaceae bacterium]MEA5100675.1 HU family DNA-binding protein [Bacteroidales bacterium]
MAITYRIWKKKFKNKDGQVEEKFFACKKTNRTLSTQEVCEQISEASSLTEGDVMSALLGLSKVTQRALSMGHNVNLEGIGTIGLSVTSAAMDSPKDISKVKVKAKRVTFRPDKRLKEILKTLRFALEKAAPKGLVSKKK